MSLPELHDALARLRDGGPWRERADERPFRCRLDSDGIGLAIEAPGPRILALNLVLPLLAERAEVFQRGQALLARPHGADGPPAPLDLADVVADLRAFLGAMPDRTDAGRPYRDLRLLTSLGSPALVEPYLRDAVRIARREARKWAPKKEPKNAEDGPPALTPAQRQAAKRTRDRALEDASAEWWLRAYFQHAEEGNLQPPPPGAWIDASDLYAQAAEALGDFADDEEELDPWDEDGEPFPARVPGLRRFYAVADRLLSPRHRVAEARRYRVPENLAPSRRDDPAVERAAEILATEFRAEAQAADGAHGSPHPSAATG